MDRETLFGFLSRRSRADSVRGCPGSELLVRGLFEGLASLYLFCFESQRWALAGPESSGKGADPLTGVTRTAFLQPPGRDLQCTPTPHTDCQAGFRRTS